MLRTLWATDAALFSAARTNCPDATAGHRCGAGYGERDGVQVLAQSAIPVRQSVPRVTRTAFSGCRIASWAYSCDCKATI